MLVYAHRDTENNHIHIVHPKSHLTEPRLTTVRSGYALKGNRRILGGCTEETKDLEKPGLLLPRWRSSRLSFSSLGYEAILRDDTLYIKAGTVQMSCCLRLKIPSRAQTETVSDSEGI